MKKCYDVDNPHHPREDANEILKNFSRTDQDIYKVGGHQQGKNKRFHNTDSPTLKLKADGDDFKFTVTDIATNVTGLGLSGLNQKGTTSVYETGLQMPGEETLHEFMRYMKVPRTD